MCRRSGMAMRVDEVDLIENFGVAMARPLCGGYGQRSSLCGIHQGLHRVLRFGKWTAFE
jgi:hypothetical protein